MRLSGELPDRGLVEPVLQEAGELEGLGQLGESRCRLAGGDLHPGHEQAREHLPPAVGSGARHAGGLAGEIERPGGLAQPKVRVADADFAQHLPSPVARLPSDRQRLLQVGARALEVAQPVVGDAPVVQDRGFPQPVAGLAEDRQRRRVGLEGLSGFAKVAVEDP